MPNLETLNQLTDGQSQTEFLRCCGSTQWTQRMVKSRPFGTRQDLIATAEKIWNELSSQDWLEAFSHHPKIGERGKLHNWAKQEQKGVSGASPQTLSALEEWNKKYEEKFGHVFLICATGKSAEEMLSAIRRRIENTSEEELKIAKDEQMKITEIRLEKLLNS